ncbi:MAG: ribonuclease P protein component [Patescibacteria group bacterium]
MLSKKKKLSSSEVRRVFNSSKKKYFRTSFFKAVFIKESDSPLFAVSVPRKIARRAVDRNRIRRRVFSLLENYYKEIKPGMYIIVMASNIVNTGEDVLIKDMERLLKGINKL